MTRSNVLLVGSYKGGVGKSTISIHLGRAFQLMGYKPVVVDMDEGNTTSCDWAKNWSANHPDTEAPLPSVMFLPSSVRQGLEQLSNAFDIVIVDAGAGAPRQNQEAVAVADLLLVPVTPSHPDIGSTLRFLGQIKTAYLQVGRPNARVVLNRISPGKASADDLIGLFSKPEMPFPSLRARILERESLKKMFSAGVTAFDTPRSNDIRSLFLDMAAEVLEIMKPQVPAPMPSTEFAPSKLSIDPTPVALGA